MSRPPLRGEPLVRVIAFRLSQSEYDLVRRAATACSLTVGQFFCAAVNDATAEVGEGTTFRARSVINTPTVSSN
jgi:uncharacterized protein (DUF1778 family)